MEILRLRKGGGLSGQTSRWQPPTDEEFQSRWVRPEGALERKPHEWQGEMERKTLLEKLKAGIVVGVARNAQLTRSSNERIVQFARIPASDWRALSPDAEYLFWTKGTLIAEGSTPGGYGGGDTQRYFEIRLDPDTFAGAPPVAEEAEEQPSSPPSMPTADQRTTDLPKAEAERFAKAVVHGWPNCTREFAREKALLFYPQHRVPRDWSYRIFRSIQGDKKPGPQPKNRD
ncbi:hypothetical protein [Sphingosinicella sp.]|uniref:hypothetical protein n=1 Tax=Sphingosinicella sp. TaxID=1917971 RepID=UPI00403819EB